MRPDKREHLEQELLQYKKQVSALQDRLDSVTKVCDEDEELNHILLNCDCYLFVIVSCF